MPVTVRQALALPELSAGDPVVLGGEAGLDADIRWVHVSEARDVAGLLVGHELVLTTGIGMAASADAAADLVGQLADVGAAGLVIELSAAYPQVPELALRRSRAAGLPLVVLNRKVRFVEVTEQVHRAIVDEQYDDLRFAGEVHETFTQLGLARASTTRLVEAAADLLGSSVVLEDLGRHVLVAAARQEPVDLLLTDWERRSRLTPFGRRTATGGPENWLSTPVGIQGGAWGRLVHPGGRDGQGVLRATQVLERAAQALELGRMIARDDTAIALRVQSGYLLDLLDDRLGPEAVAVARLRALGVKVGAEYVGAVARLRDEPGGGVQAAEQRMVRLSEGVHDALAAAGVSGLVGVLDGSHVGLLVTDDAALDSVARELVALEPGAVLGAGRPADRLLAAAGSLRSARVVADAATTMPALPGCARQSDIRLPGLLMSLHGDLRLQEFVEAELGRLLEHEARHGAGLVELLRGFLLAGGNKTELARTSHRNRTSLYPALRRLEELVGHPLDDPESRLALGVALLAYDQGRALQAAPPAR